MAQHKKDYKPEDIMYPEQAIVESELVKEMKFMNLFQLDNSRKEIYRLMQFVN